MYLTNSPPTVEMDSYNVIQTCGGAIRYIMGQVGRRSGSSGDARPPGRGVDDAGNREAAGYHFFDTASRGVARTLALLVCTHR